MAAPAHIKVVDLQQEKERRQSETWQAYRAAHLRAQDCLKIEDAIEAGKAWRRWLDLFLTDDQRGRLAAAGKITQPNFRNHDHDATRTAR